MSFRIILLACLLFGSLSMPGQNSTYTVETTQAQYLGRTAPLRILIPQAQEWDSQKAREHRKNFKVPPNFRNRRPYTAFNDQALPAGPDPLAHSLRNGGIIVEPEVNVQGLGRQNSPQDPTGDIGKDHYLQAVNATTLQVYDKMGVPVGAPFAANTIWSSIGFSSAGDPIVLYDQSVNRWLITEFPSGNQLLIAVSDDSDPLGSYTAYNFSTPNFPDYPKYAIWDDMLVVTTNESGPSNLPTYFIDKNALYAGEALVNIQRIVLQGFSNGPGFQVASPTDWTGLATPVNGPIILTMADDAWAENSFDAIQVHQFEIDFEDSNNTVITVDTIAVSAFDSNPCSVPGVGFSCVPQLGGNGIDGLPEVITNQPHYRNFGSYEAIVMAFITDVDGNNLSGIRWIELRRLPGEDWSVYQEGTVTGDDGYDRFMPSICMDSEGNIGLIYNVSSETIYPGIALTGRRVVDPLGQMTVEEYMVAEGENSGNNNGRFSDYAHMSIDPTDDRTFWATAAYPADGQMATRVFSFRLGRDTTDIAALTKVSPQDSPDLTNSETLSFEIKNLGLDTVSSFTAGYIIDNQPAVTEMVTQTILPDSSYIHSFATTGDFSTVGAYNVTFFASMDMDQQPLNDTLRTVVRKIPRFDVGISDLAGLTAVNCGDTVTYGMGITNYGTESIFSLQLETTLNDVILDTTEWTGILLPGASLFVPRSITQQVDGINNLSVRTLLPNGNPDEVIQNDAFSRVFDALIGGVSIFIELTFDNYPTETSWKIFDENDNVIHSAGPYTNDLAQATIVEEVCLDPEQCYRFRLEDDFGDGITAYGIDGDYTIKDSNGFPLATLQQVNFGSFEDNDFCATFSCAMEVSASFSPTSTAGASDGSILLVTNNGVGPYMFSIDGGDSFQESALFEGLAEGVYNYVVTGGADCEADGQITVIACTLNAMVQVENATASDQADGSIRLTNLEGTPPYSFSIDGDSQGIPLFSGLTPGTYEVAINDANGCTMAFTVTVDFSSSSSSIPVGVTMELLPNPTQALFQINLRGFKSTTEGPFLPVAIYNTQGRLLQHSQLTRYSDRYTGMFSLDKYPAGTYYVRIKDPNLQQMLKVVKID